MTRRPVACQPEIVLADVMAGVLSVENQVSGGWSLLIDMVAHADDDQLDRIIAAADALADAAREVQGLRRG